MTKMKKILVFLVILFALTTGSAFGRTMDVRVIVDGKIMESQETEGNKKATGFIDSNRTYVPLRLVGEALKCKVDYRPETKNIDITKDGMALQFNVNSKDFTVNGEKKSMDVKPLIYKNRTYLPIRFIGEAFDKEVRWEGKSYSCIVGDLGNIQLDNLKKLEENYKIYTFGNPKVTVKVPKDLMKDLVVEEDYVNNIIRFHEAQGYGVEDRVNGMLLEVHQMDKETYEAPVATDARDKLLSVDQGRYLTLNHVIFQDMEEVYRPKLETPHYKALLKKLEVGLVISQEKQKSNWNTDKYKTYTFGNPKVTVEIPTRLMKHLLVIENEFPNGESVRIYDGKKFYDTTDETRFFYAVEQFNDPEFDAERTRSEVIDKKGNRYTVKYPTKYIYEAHPVYDQLLETIRVKVEK